MQIDDVIDFLRALPGTTEEPHHQRLSARVKGKIYATWPLDGRSVNVMLGEAGRAEVGPGIAELWWGKTLSGVQVDLAVADDVRVRALLEAAWRRAGGRPV